MWKIQFKKNRQRKRVEGRERKGKKKIKKYGEKREEEGRRERAMEKER